MTHHSASSSRAFSLRPLRFTFALLALPLLALFASAPASGQFVLEFTDELGFDDPEAWAMKYTHSLATMTGLGVPRSLDPGQISVAVEGSSVPTLSEEELRVGFDGQKVENLNRTSVFGRVRLTVGLPAGFSATLGYVPPVEIDGVEPNLWALALARPLHEAEGWRLGLRLFAQGGSVEGDITCDAPTVAAGNDPVINPFGCEERSQDEVTLDAYGAELGIAFRAGSSGKLWPYLAVTASKLDAEFQVNARYGGLIDQTLLVADGWTYAATAGLSYEGDGPLGWSAELYYAPLDVIRPPATTTQNDALFNVRALLTYRLR